MLVFGVGLRLLVAARGHNYDMDSFAIAARIVERGGNVYAETERYNYGPLWFYLCYLFWRIAGLLPVDQLLGFRYVLSGFLSLVDVGIMAALWGRFGRRVAFLLFLNPISILISGYHGQFDNLALLLGMAAVLRFGEDFGRPLDRRKWGALALLGLSLVTKHILFAFPLWLAAKQRGAWQKIAILVVPVAIFFVAFLPFWSAGRQGIIQNVFLYGSWDNPYFYNLFVPGVLARFLSPRLAWYAVLVLLAFAVRRRKGFDSLLVYGGALVAASPAITNQYLVIPVPLISAYPNPSFLLYTVVGAWQLLVDKHGLHIARLRWLLNLNKDTYYSILVVLLCIGLAWLLWRKQILAAARWTLAEARAQLRGEEPDA